MGNDYVTLFENKGTSFSRDAYTGEFIININNGVDVDRVSAYVTLTNMREEANSLRIVVSGEVTAPTQKLVSMLLSNQYKFPCDLVIKDTATKSIDITGNAHYLTIEGSSIYFLDIVGYIKTTNLYRGTNIDNFTMNVPDVEAEKVLYVNMGRALVNNMRLRHDGLVEISMEASHISTYNEEKVEVSTYRGTTLHVFESINLAVHELFGCSIMDLESIMEEIDQERGEYK